MKSATLSKKGILAQIFSCEFYEIFKDIFFYETHLVAASVAVKFFFHQRIKEICHKANLLFYLVFSVFLYNKKGMYTCMVKSKLNKCPLVWMFCSRRSNNLFNKVQDRVLKITPNVQ